MEIIEVSHMDTEEMRQARRRARIAQMKREKRRQELLYKWGIPVIALLVVIGAGVWVGIRVWPRRSGAETAEESRTEESVWSMGNAVSLLDETPSPGETGQAGADQSTEAGTLASASAAESSEAGAEGAVAAESQPVCGELLALAGKNFSDSVASSAREPLSQFLPSLGGTLPGVSVQLGDPAIPPKLFEKNENTEGFSETIVSKYGIFLDVENGAVLAHRAGFDRMNPASMTKVLTVLVAADHLTEKDLDETVTITIDITDYSYVNDCSNTGYARDEVVTVRDLFYGTILPSGADSALALAVYVAGSHEAFVDMMNEKLAQLGLAETSHFTNSVGLYNENHYTTAYDMAVMLKAAADNPFLREVLSAHTYTTSKTAQHPEGIMISNWFLRRIEDRDTHGEVLCGKTGFVNQSGSCAVSLGIDSNGREYLCVTAGSTNQWTCLDDQAQLYRKFLPAS